MPLRIENLSRKTILRTSRDLFDPTSADHTLQELTNCYIYILASLAEIAIRGCESCVIITGVTTTLTVENCNACKIISITKTLKVQETSDTTFHLCVNTRPVLTRRNFNLKFAPYNTFYSQLETHITLAGVKTSLKDNFWNDPMDFVRARAASMSMARDAAKAGNTETEKTPEYSFTLLSPEEFLPLVVPFNLPGTTKANPIKLPIEYSTALEKRTKAMSNIKEIISHLVEEEKELLRNQIGDKFQEWLVESGNIQQINDLLDFK